MFEGSILKAGKPEELAKDEMVRKVYLGKNFELRKKKVTFWFTSVNQFKSEVKPKNFK